MRRAVVGGRVYTSVGVACRYAADDEVVEIFEDETLLGYAYMDDGDWVVRWSNYGGIPGGVVYQRRLAPPELPSV